MVPVICAAWLLDQHSERMIQPVQRRSSKYEFSRQYPALKQNGYDIADELAGLLPGGHRTLLSIFRRTTCSIKNVAPKHDVVNCPSTWVFNLGTRNIVTLIHRAKRD